mgnify:CR=1 FL=1
MYTQRQLEICMKSAYSYENRAGWEKEYLSVEQIGMVQRGERVYSLYEDSEGNYWYKLFFMTDHGLITEYEKIFGHPEKKELST